MLWWAVVSRGEGVSSTSDTVVMELAHECKPVLERRARRQLTITYDELAREVGPKVGISDLHPRDKRLHAAIGEIGERTYHNHGFNLSAVVVLKQTGLPGNGFYWQMQENLKAYGKRKGRQAVFDEELPKVFAHYGRGRRGVR